MIDYDTALFGIDIACSWNSLNTSLWIDVIIFEDGLPPMKRRIRWTHGSRACASEWALQIQPGVVVITAQLACDGSRRPKTCLDFRQVRNEIGDGLRPIDCRLCPGPGWSVDMRWESVAGKAAVFAMVHFLVRRILPSKNVPWLSTSSQWNRRWPAADKLQIMSGAGVVCWYAMRIGGRKSCYLCCGPLFSPTDFAILAPWLWSVRSVGFCGSGELTSDH